MRDALKSYLALASGVTDVTRARAVAAAKALVAQGEATAEQVTGLAEDLVAQTRQNREAVVALVTFEVDRALGRVGLASADEVAQLTARVRALEAEVRELRSAGAPAAADAPGNEGAAAEAAPAKEAAAKKAPAKKDGAKKDGAKKAAPARAAEKPAAEKAVAPKAAAPADAPGPVRTPEPDESPA